MDHRIRLRPLAGVALATTLVMSSAVVQAQSPSASPATEPSAAPSGAPIPVISDACTFDQLQTQTQGRLIIGADNPAYPPWFGGTPGEGSKWEISDPYSGEGFESAIAYAVANELGFSPDLVDWKFVNFVRSFAPGPKAFDLYITQVSIKPKRAEAVDLSDPYYTVNQSIIALTGNPITAATTIEELKAFKLGAQVATTSLDLINEVVAPTTDARVYTDNDKALRGLRNGTIDGLVVDLPTAFFMRDGQLEDFDTPDPEGTIVGQFPVIGSPEQLGIVLEKGSPLTACVNEALAIIAANGVWQQIYDQYLGATAAAPVPFFAIDAVAPEASASAAP